MVGQGEGRCGRGRDGRQSHQVDLVVRDAGAYPGGTGRLTAGVARMMAYADAVKPTAIITVVSPVMTRARSMP